jgi:hypothetical protein
MTKHKRILLSQISDWLAEYPLKRSILLNVLTVWQTSVGSLIRFLQIVASEQIRVGRVVIAIG